MENRFDPAIVKRDRKIIEQRKAGRSYTEIGKPLGMTKYRVQRIVERDAPEYTGHIFRRLREAEFYKDKSLPVIDPARATAAAIPPDITRDVTVARDLAKGDLPFKEISTLMGVSVQQLNAWERKYGIRNRREDGLGNPVPFEFDEVLFDLDECGFSYAEISAIVAERRRGRSYAEIAKRHDIRWMTARAVIARKAPELLSGPRGREGKSPKGG